MTIILDTVNIAVPLFLAPMAGVTDLPFRRICREFGADVTYSEFVSSEGIVRQNEKTLRYMILDPADRPVGIQLFGQDPDVLADAAVFAESRFKPDIIDLNFGCPVPKVVKKGGGSAILKDLNRVHAVASAVVKAVKTPVTAKIRAGWNEQSVIIPEIGPILEDAGIRLITLHPRTTRMGYTGRSDWSLIAALKESVRIPVIGNGDIRSAGDALTMINETGCDGVMVGRGTFGNPWLLAQIRAALQNENPIPDPTPAEKCDLMKRHFSDICDYYGPLQAFNLFKPHFAWYSAGIPHAARFKQAANRCRSVREMETVIHDFTGHATQLT